MFLWDLAPFFHESKFMLFRISRYFWITALQRQRPHVVSQKNYLQFMVFMSLVFFAARLPLQFFHHLFWFISRFIWVAISGIIDKYTKKTTRLSIKVSSIVRGGLKSRALQLDKSTFSKHIMIGCTITEILYQRPTSTCSKYEQILEKCFIHLFSTLHNWSLSLESIWKKELVSSCVTSW